MERAVALLTKDRKLALTMLGPAVALGICGILIPRWALFFVGAGIGWLVVAPFILRGSVQMQYRTAVRHMRRGEYDRAIAIMDTLVQAEPDNAGHVRFRANLYRLAGQLDAALRDFERVTVLDPATAGAYIGLAELYVQRGEFAPARAAAQTAATHDPHGWTPRYTLGLIADRQGDAPAALAALEGLVPVVPHSRDRLLVRVWLARAYARQGQTEAAQQQIDALRQDAGSLREWRLILDSAQGTVLRPLLGPDVDLAAQLLDGSAALDRLKE